MSRRRPIEFYHDRNVSVCFDGPSTRVLRTAFSSNDTQQTLAQSDQMLHRLLRRQGGDGQGVLYSHPTQCSEVAVWLSQHTHLGWRLEPDATLKAGEMRLVTEGGEFKLRW